MGFGTLNVWVRNERCHVIADRWAHLHVYDCHGHQVMGQSIYDGHVEVQVPPGCYVLTAGVGTSHGNRYTDKTMVVVSCGQTACVNLVLNRFREAEVRELHPIARGCAARLLGPLFFHAGDIDPDELRLAAGVILRAARIDPKEMAKGLQEEAAHLREHEEEWQKDPGKPGAYVEAIEGLAKTLTDGGKKQE